MEKQIKNKLKELQKIKHEKQGNKNMRVKLRILEDAM